MAQVQKYFEEFHNIISLGTYEENATLRDKRDLLLKNLREGLDRNDEDLTFSSFDQGSYAMHTGVVPKNGDYDIDVGLVFDCKKEDYTDPVALKKIVRDALQCGNRTVAIRRSCVTVIYTKNQKNDYHVDLAVYADREDDVLDLAKGKENSDSDKRIWETSDPKGLKKTIRDKFSDKAERAQMRRLIRYLKRWRDHKLPSGRPVSIALTCAAWKWMTPSFSQGNPVDLLALKSLCSSMLLAVNSGSLKIELPVNPWNDLNERVTDNQMSYFLERLQELYDELYKAQYEPEIFEACKILRKQFGDEFPVPEEKDTAKKAAPAIVPAGSSA